MIKLDLEVKYILLNWNSESENRESNVNSKEYVRKSFVLLNCFFIILSLRKIVESRKLYA